MDSMALCVGRTIAGPSTRCADTAGLLACIDEIYAHDGTCDTDPINVRPVFGHFTALPPANDYRAVCTAPDPPPATR